MTQKTSNTHDKFHINLSDSGIYHESYLSFLEYEPLIPCDSPESDVCANSEISTPQVASEVSDSSEVLEIPEIQESTHQVPCGPHSIFDPEQKVPAFAKAVYLVLNEHSNWDTGVSHALSLRRLAKLLNVKNHSQVHHALHWLINNGWILVKGERKSDGTHFYQLIHHKCEPQDTPTDADGRPQKCAVPMGAGSVGQLLAEGKITWRIFVDWTVRKVHSDWTTGIVSLSVREAATLAGFSPETIKENAETMMETGLAERISKRFRRSQYQLFPKPYPQRRERKQEVYPIKKSMKLIKGWYYSFNGLWKFNRETFEIKMQEIDGRWRYSNLEELYTINKSIHRDFRDYFYHLSLIFERSAEA